MLFFVMTYRKKPSASGGVAPRPLPGALPLDPTGGLLRPPDPRIIFLLFHFSPVPCLVFCLFLFCFLSHKSSLVCMVEITYVYTVFGFYGVHFNKNFNAHLYCLVGCLSMIVWTHAWVSYMLVFCTFVFAPVLGN